MVKKIVLSDFVHYLPISVHFKINSVVDSQSFGLLILIFFISLPIKAYTQYASHKIWSKIFHFSFFSAVCVYMASD